MHNHMLHIPNYVTSFVGRTVEIDTVSSLLCESKQRVVVLFGSSGTGKSRLSREVAFHVVDMFADGVAFVSLAAVEDPTVVLPSIAETLGIVEQADSPLIETLIAALKSKRMLLILDNFEQVYTAAAELQTLVANTTYLTLLITSQVQLNLPDAYVYTVPPLAMPNLSRRYTPDELLQYPAIALFVERLRETIPQFELSENNAEAVHEMCVRVAGLPLAIELVAAHSWGLHPNHVRDLLSNHLALVPLDDVTHLTNDQVLAPLLDWCFAMLHPSLQVLFTRLGVFRGGCTRAAIDPVCNSQDDLALDIIAGMEKLVAKHLVNKVKFDNEDVRYSMLDIVLSYVKHKLSRSSEARIVTKAHAAYFQQLAEDASVALTGAEQARWLNLIAAEHHNMRAALERLMRLHAYDQAAFLAGALARFWYMRSHLREGRQWFERILAHDQVLSDKSHAIALQGAGMIAIAQSDYAYAEKWLHAAITLQTTIGDKQRVGIMFNSLGLIAWNRDQFEKAQHFFEESIAYLRPFNDTNAITNVLSNLGIIAFEQGDWNTSAAYYQECLTLRRTLGNPYATAICLNNFGVTSLAQGNLEQAQTLLNESLVISRELGADGLMALAYSVLGRVHFELGHYVKAHESLLESLRLRQKIDDHASLVETLGKLSLWAHVAGDPKWAVRTLGLVYRFREEHALGFDYLERRWYTQATDDLKKQLGVREYRRQWEDGRSSELQTIVSDYLLHHSSGKDKE